MSSGRFFAGRVLENVEALGVGLHEAVFDAVVHHLHEVPGARRPAVNVAFFGGAAEFFAAGSARNVAASRRQRFENRIEPLHRFFRAADHHAVAALESPHAAAGADVDVVNAFALEFIARRTSSLK